MSVRGLDRFRAYVRHHAAARLHRVALAPQAVDRYTGKHRSINHACEEARCQEVRRQEAREEGREEARRQEGWQEGLRVRSVSASCARRGSTPGAIVDTHGHQSRSLVPRSQELLVRALRDPTFLDDMRSRGVATSQLLLWAKEHDVPITMRGQMRGLLEDWVHAHPSASAGLPS
jgi:hypothetical protein